MKLEKLILVNWGALRTQEYPMGGMTLLTGPTGAGKSTFLDAMQTVMTAAYQGIFSYNPGQDETTQGARNGKSKRSLWSYIAGAEDNLFARPDGAHGYIAAVFRPSEGEDGKPFTALVAAAARIEGSGTRRQAVQERLALLIVDDAALTLAELTEIDAQGRMQVIPVEKIQHHLKAHYQNVKNFRDTKRDYLCALYGRFRGLSRGVSFPEAEQAARAWSQSIAHKPIGSVDELVKTQILEHDIQTLGQRISHISDLMRQVAQLRTDGERLKNNISRLEHVADASQRTAKAFEDHLTYQAVLSKRALQEDDQRQSDLEKQVMQIEADIEGQRRAADALGADRRLKDDSRIQIQARLAGIPASGQKQKCEERLAQADARARTIIAALIAKLGTVQDLRRIASQIAGAAFPLASSGLNEAAALVAHAYAACTHADFSASDQVLRALVVEPELAVSQLQVQSQAFKLTQAGLTALFATIAGPEHSFVAAVHAELTTVVAAIADASRREKDAAARKASLAGGGADYSREARHTLEQLRSQMPACRPQVLCDLIEPVDIRWQRAIEGYMGGARFSIIVEPDWERRAIDLARDNKLGGRIVQGALCQRHARDVVLAPDSIVHELATEHPIAKAYLADLYGRVLKVDDSEQLRYTPQGVTLDGRASGGRTMFVVSTVDLVFGKEAKRLARERAEQEHAKIERELVALRAQKDELHALLALAGRAQDPDLDAALELEPLGVAIDAARADLARLDLTEVEELEAQSKALQAEIESIDERIGAMKEKVGGLKSDITKCRDEAVVLQGRRPAKQQRFEHDRIRLQNLTMVNSALSFTGLMEQVDELLANGRLSYSETQQRANGGLVNAQRMFGDVREHLADYNQNARPDERFEALGLAERSEDFAPIYGELVLLLRRAHAQLQAQRDIGLVKNLDQLRNAEESFKDVFTKQFCAEIRNAVDTGTKTLRQLNNELERLKFGTDKFRIDWSEWVPEYKAYYDFFCAAYDLGEAQEALSLFGASQLSVENCRVRDQMVGLLLSNDQEHAVRELGRIADYRNYRRYEIWKESDTGSKVALSEWGTGSGGQLETPAYIVRAAIVTNRLKHFDKGMNLKLIVNDESFSKMDERRAHDVMRFMRDNLGMQLVCAMPTKHAGALKSAFTKEWSFSRTEAQSNGEVDFVSEPDERDLQPDRLTQLWDQRRAQVREQARMVFEKAEQAA